MILLILIQFTIVYCQTDNETIADAVYREGGFLNNLDHAGIYVGLTEIVHIGGYFCEVEIVDWSGFLDGQDYICHCNNSNMDISHRASICLFAEDLLDFTDISYTAGDALNYDDSNPNFYYIQPDEVTDIRCDGIVEYCYEYYGIPVWAMNQDISHYDISSPSFVNEHNNLGANQPDVELSPKVQRGGSGHQYTFFDTICMDIDNDFRVMLKGNHILSNYPNPFNPTTSISYSLTKDISDPEICIYNIKGQKVKTFELEAEEGENKVIWNGEDENNKSVASGVYFYRLSDGDRVIA